MISTKICVECGRDLPLSEYNKRRDNKDGCQSRCRACFSKYNKARYAANKEKFKADIYAYKEANPQKVLETRIKTCAKNPTQKNARRALNAAVEAGAMKVPDSCSGCGVSGSETRLGAHHYDYAKPLDVVWVCARCHRHLDAERRMREGKPPYGRSRAVQMLQGESVICSFETIADAARAVGCSSSSISACLKGESKTAAGFRWRYLEEVNDAQATNGKA